MCGYSKKYNKKNARDLNKKQHILIRKHKNDSNLKQKRERTIFCRKEQKFVFANK